MADTDLLDYAGLKHYDSKIKSCMWNWQKTKKNALVQFKPVPDSDLEPVVDFMFTETPPAESEKGPENPSTISGVSEVKATRCGKNLYGMRLLSTTTKNGVTYSVDNDGVITLDGTATANSSVSFNALQNVPIAAGTKITSHNVILSGSYTAPNGGDAFKNQITVKFSSGSSAYPGAIDGQSISVVMQNDGEITYYTSQVFSGATFNNLKVKTQIEIGDAVSTYEPYTAIQQTIQLGDTYYGGSLDVATGVMTVTHYYRTLPASIATDLLPSAYNFATGRIWPSNFTDFIEEHGYVPRPANSIVCDKLPTHTGGGYTTDCISLGTYNAANQTSPINITLARSTLGLGSGDISANDIRTAMVSWISSNNPIVVYPLHTPYTIQLTPTQIRSLPALDKYEPRINTVYTDQEAVQVGYQRFFDENRIAAIEARLDALEGN